MRTLAVLFLRLASLVLFATDVRATCIDAPVLTGVNLAGAEFNADKLPGVLNKDYVYPSAADLQYFASLGINTVRLPILWERVQPKLDSPLDDAQLASIAATIALAKHLNLCVILDVHNYGSYRGKPIGSTAVSVDDFVDLWTRLAARFSDESGDESMIAFDLMNEPNALPIATWANTAKATLAKLRASGSKNLVLVSGGRWSGVHEWGQEIGGSSNAREFSDLRDPAGRMLIEVHQYADADYSGTKASCVEADRFKDMFVRLTAWARENKQQLFLGEFGVPPNGPCLADLKAMLTQIQDKTVWRGWAYWAAGAWWGDYAMSIEPRDGREPSQVAVLRDFLSDGHVENTKGVSP